VTKEFQAKVLVSARPDGTVIVHNLGNGVRPLCYIDGGAEISIARNLADVEIEFFATTEDGQQLTLQFTEITAMQGVPSSKQSNSMAMSILKCVFDLGGNYGRTTIARVLTGSVSKKILTINISKLGTYGTAKDTSMKEVLSLMDWLIQENYLAYVEDSEFPVLVVTSKGLDVLAGGEVPIETRTEPDTSEIERRKAVLKEWRDRKTNEMGKPPTF
jgi:superfamily II DNA helicase RecQ